MILPVNQSLIPEDKVHRIKLQMLRYFTGIFSLSKDTQKALTAYTSVVRYHSKDIILKYGQICNYSLYCPEGLAYVTALTEDSEKVVRFMGAEGLIVSVNSWFDQSPSEEQIRAIRPTICVPLGYREWEMMMRDHSDFTGMYTRLIEKLFAYRDEQAKWDQLPLDIKIDTIEQIHPDFFKDIPKTLIANYFGITREYLSKKLSQRSKKDLRM